MEETLLNVKTERSTHARLYAYKLKYQHATLSEAIAGLLDEAKE